MHGNHRIGIGSEKTLCDKPPKTEDRQWDCLILLDWAKSAIKPSNLQGLISVPVVLIYGEPLSLDVLVRAGAVLAERLFLLKSQLCSPLSKKFVD